MRAQALRRYALPAHVRLRSARGGFVCGHDLRETGLEEQRGMITLFRRRSVTKSDFFFEKNVALRHRIETRGRFPIGSRQELFTPIEVSLFDMQTCGPMTMIFLSIRQSNDNLQRYSASIKPNSNSCTSLIRRRSSRCTSGTIYTTTLLFSGAVLNLPSLLSLVRNPRYSPPLARHAPTNHECDQCRRAS